MSDASDVRYLVLADRAVPYLLARVRWPDVAQAISAARPDWLDDPGLFDLPYDPSVVTVSFPQAVSVAAGWGRQLHAEPAENVPSYIRRMPATWSDLSPSERRTWGIEFVGRRRAPARRIRRLRPLQAKIAGSSAAARANGQTGALARPGGDPGAGVDVSATNGHHELAHVTSGLGSVATERRRQVRVRLDGRAHIRYEHSTISAGLVDLGERGVRCVLPEASSVVTSGVTLTGPFLLEAEVAASQICLDVAGRISWHRSTEAGTHFGIAFEELANGETEGVQRLLAAAGRK
jgi:hypothetical protein